MAISFESFSPATRQEWRDWLIENHATEPGVYLVYYKKSSGKPSIAYSDAVKEALCFGWIDSKVNTLDSERYQQVFTPRKKTSNWSRLNKQYVDELMAAGLMTEAGLASIEHAKQTGRWNALDEVEDLRVPEDLQQALAVNPKAKQYFEAFSRSAKRAILEWLLNAKRTETRLRRVEEIVRMAAQNKKANQPD
jgi:uncharacterized protein YdeI (YjbR/CyaY-like superfamily)